MDILTFIERGSVQPASKEAEAIKMAFNLNENEITWPPMRPLKRYSNLTHNDGGKDV